MVASSCTRSGATRRKGPSATMRLSDIEIDKGLPTPAYLQLKQRLARAMDLGLLPPGSALPSERSLAASLGLSRMTIRRAFEELEEAGLVQQRQGSGTYVKGQPLEQIIDRVIGFTDEARHLGLKPGARLLGTAKVAADDQIAAALGLRPGDAVLRISRLRTADGEPLALQDAHLPTHLLDLSVAELERSGSLYRTLEQQFGIRPIRARQTIGARLPTRAEIKALGIGREVPVLALERTTYGADERPFEYVRSAYRGDLYRMALDLRAQ